jgi:hypothetical protein
MYSPFTSILQPSIKDDNELTQALGGYAEKQFKDRFGFDYHTTPPDYPSSSKDLVAALSRQQLLQYSQDDPGHTKLPDLVRNYFSWVFMWPNSMEAPDEETLAVFPFRRK